MAKFEVVKKYEDAGLALPERKTSGSAGYDLASAEDYIIPSYRLMANEIEGLFQVADDEYLTLENMAQLTKETGFKPTLISTGMKCKLDPDTFLQLNIRSSSPLKYWLIMANSSGIIDSDYYNNPDNEGEIFLQIINLSPFNLQIKKGEIIGQGIIIPYLKTEDDNSTETRVGGFGSTSENK